MSAAVNTPPSLSVLNAETPSAPKKVVRRRVAKNTQTPAPPAAVVVNEPIPVPVVPEVKVETIPVEIVSNEEPLESFVESSQTETLTESKKRTVKIANKEKLLDEYEKLYPTLEKILTEQNLKPVLKDVKSIRDMTYKLLKLKTGERQKRDNHTSGFLKPVQISDELKTFLQKNNLYQDEITRAYLTTVLCAYIKNKNLQNSEDKRIILPDADLKSLFSVEDGEQLTYYSIQKKIQRHIFK